MSLGERPSGAPRWIVPICASRRRPAVCGPGECPVEDWGRLYGTVSPLRKLRFRGCRENAPVTSSLAWAQRVRRDAPVLNRAFSGSTNGGASLRRAHLTDPRQPIGPPSTENNAQPSPGPADRLKGLPRRPTLADDTFDVFFSYNSKDRDRPSARSAKPWKPGVSRVWMDEQQIDPGARWMQALQEIIPKASASAIFLGPHGLGQWQKPEIEACIDQNIKRKMPVIPVPLPGLAGRLQDPPFL